MREGDRQTEDRHTDTGDFIICPMLRYSNGTDNNWQTVMQQKKRTASIVAYSIVDAISFVTGVLLCDQKTSFSQIRLRSNLKKSNSVQP